MESAPLSHQDLQTIIENAGLRCIPQRLAVYDYLSQSTEHPTAEDVYQAVRARVPRISLATVYKALEALVTVGVASKRTAGPGGNRSRYDARRDLRYHFRCLRSGTVHDLPTRFDPDLIAKLDPHLHGDLSRQGFQVTGYRLELVGYQNDPSASTTHAASDGCEHRESPGQLATDLPARGAAKAGASSRTPHRAQSPSGGAAKS